MLFSVLSILIIFVFTHATLQSWFDSRQKQKISLRRRIQTGSTTDPTTYLKCTGGTSLVYNDHFVKLASHLHPVLKLGMSGTIPVRYLHTFTACKGVNLSFHLICPSKPRPLKHPPNIFFPKIKTDVPHFGRAPVIVRLRSIVVFLSPRRQVPDCTSTTP